MSRGGIPVHRTTMSMNRRHTPPSSASVKMHGRCSRTLGYEHDAAAPRLARAATSLALPPVRARRHRASLTPWRRSWPAPWSWPPPPSETCPPHAAGRLRLRVHERERESEREDAQTKDEVMPHTRGEHEKIRTKWMPHTACFEFFNRHSTLCPSPKILSPAHRI
jgi:hypothetical protein